MSKLSPFFSVLPHMLLFMHTYSLAYTIGLFSSQFGPFLTTYFAA